MNTNNRQLDQVPQELLNIPNENEGSTDQLLFAEVITSNQTSTIQGNPAYMIPSIQEQRYQPTRRQQRQQARQHLRQQQQQERQRLRQQQREEQRERQRRRRERRERRYEQSQSRLAQRDHERWLRQLEETQHLEYLKQCGPNFDERMDEKLTERESEEYFFEDITPQESQEVWEQAQLDEFQGNPAPRGHGMPPDNTEMFSKFLQDQLQQDEHDYAKEWEDTVFGHP